MSNSSEYYIKALETVRQNKERAENMAASKQDQIYRDHPYLKSLDMKISSIFADSVKRKLNGEAVDFDSVSAQSLEYQAERKLVLADFGLTEDDLKPAYKCKLCNDSGYAKNGKICECVKFIAAKMMYDDINKDVPLEKSTFSSFYLHYYPNTPDKNGIVPREIMAKIRDLCISYANKFTPKSTSMLFIGKTGLGKTHLSLAIANEVISKGYNVIYAPIARVLQQIESEYFSRESNDNPTLFNVINSDLLIIDDLGTEFTTPFITSTMYDIINSRILSGRPTIINSNLSLEELEKRYSDRIVSRISNSYKIYNFIGEDIRTLL